MTRSLALSAALTVLLWAVVVSAGPMVVHWDPSPGATAYEIEASADAGATWAKVGPDVPPSACTGTPSRCTATVTLPATGYHLVRFAAKNAVGKTVRMTAGVWYCESCQPPAAPQQMGTP